MVFVFVDKFCYLSLHNDTFTELVVLLLVQEPLVFVHFTTAFLIISHFRLLKLAVSHQLHAISFILINLLVQSPSFAILLFLQISGVADIPHFNQLILDLDHVESVGGQEISFILLEHHIKPIVQLQDLSVNFICYLDDALLFLQDAVVGDDGFFGVGIRVVVVDGLV